jgi:hypothetical protein
MPDQARQLYQCLYPRFTAYSFAPLENLRDLACVNQNRVVVVEGIRHSTDPAKDYRSWKPSASLFCLAPKKADLHAIEDVARDAIDAYNAGTLWCSWTQVAGTLTYLGTSFGKSSVWKLDYGAPQGKAQFAFDPYAGYDTGTLEVNYYASSATAGGSIFVYSSTAHVLAWVTIEQADGITYAYDHAACNAISTCAPVTWYNVKIVLNFTTQHYSVYIDDVLKAADYGFVTAGEAHANPTVLIRAEGAATYVAFCGGKFTPTTNPLPDYLHLGDISAPVKIADTSWASIINLDLIYHYIAKVTT